MAEKYIVTSLTTREIHDSCKSSFSPDKGKLKKGLSSPLPTPLRHTQEAEICIHAFFISALVLVSGKLHAPADLYPRKETLYLRNRELVGPRSQF
jgi:hypothetical protein